MRNKKIKKVLLIGAGANDFGRESELDTAAYQVIDALKELGIATVLVDDNPYSYALESENTTAYMRPLTSRNIQEVIDIEHPDAVLPAVGGTTAFRIVEELAQFDGNMKNITFLGVNLKTVLQINNPGLLNERLRAIGEPVIISQVANSIEDAFDIARTLGFPVIVKPVAPQFEASRQQANDSDDLDRALTIAFRQSLTNQVVIDQGINGLREVGLEVMRDSHDTNMFIGAVEDVDPIGIHAADSIIVSPVQTLTDREFQRLRTSAFRIMRALNIVGIAHIQFALDPKTDTYFVIKVSPYFDMTSALVARSTGYPMALVMASVVLGIPLTKVQLPSVFASKTAIIEPVMDHVVVRFPVFAFGEIENAGVKVNRELDTMQKSVGSTIGIGRSIEEALEKAIRAAHFSNRSFSPTIMNALPENDLIQQLIHPRDNRVLLLIEALRRGYTVDELAELTKIDEYYFYKLQHIMELEREVAAHPGDISLLTQAKYYGLSDGLIAKLWHQDFDDVRRLGRENNLVPTYKAIEPSAGEFPENVTVYYSTFEMENESERLSEQPVLVIGTGAFRLGDGASGSYTTAVVLDELRRNNIRSIIMNNNPNDLSLTQQLADKQYIEPLEISDVMNVVELEEPAVVIVPGNRIKLINALRDRDVNVRVLAKEKYSPAGPAKDVHEYAANYLYDGQQLRLISLTDHIAGKLMMDHEVLTTFISENIPLPKLDFDTPGLYQVVSDQLPLPSDVQPSDMRPMPYGQVAFMNKITGVNWWRLIIRMFINEMTETDKKILAQLPLIPWDYRVSELVANDTDFYQHLQPDATLDTTQFEMGVSVRIVKK